MSEKGATFSLAIDVRPYIAAIERIVEVMADLHVTPNGQIRRVDKHHPRPLSIDGHAYHQRSKNRRKR